MHLVLLAAAAVLACPNARLEGIREALRKDVRTLDGEDGCARLAFFDHLLAYRVADDGTVHIGAFDELNAAAERKIKAKIPPGTVVTGLIETGGRFENTTVIFAGTYDVRFPGGFMNTYSWPQKLTIRDIVKNLRASHPLTGFIRPGRDAEAKWFPTQGLKAPTVDAALASACLPCEGLLCDATPTACFVPLVPGSRGEMIEFDSFGAARVYSHDPSGSVRTLVATETTRFQLIAGDDGKPTLHEVRNCYGADLCGLGKSGCEPPGDLRFSATDPVSFTLQDPRRSRQLPTPKDCSIPPPYQWVQDSNGWAVVYAGIEDIARCAPAALNTLRAEATKIYRSDDAPAAAALLHARFDFCRDLLDAPESAWFLSDFALFVTKSADQLACRELEALVSSSKHLTAETPGFKALRHNLDACKALKEVASLPEPEAARWAKRDSKRKPDPRCHATGRDEIPAGESNATASWKGDLNGDGRLDLIRSDGACGNDGCMYTVLSGCGGGVFRSVWGSEYATHIEVAPAKHRLAGESWHRLWFGSSQDMCAWNETASFDGKQYRYTRSVPSTDVCHAHLDGGNGPWVH